MKRNTYYGPLDFRAPNSRNDVQKRCFASRCGTTLFVGGIALFGIGCAGPSAPAAPLHYVNHHSVTMRLHDGEVVTIQPAAPPAKVLASQVPASILSAVRSHRALTIGRFRSVVQNDDIGWTTHLPRPAGGAVNAVTPVSTSALHALHAESVTGYDSDHSTNGWYIDGYDTNANYESEGYIQFNADMGLPQLYPAIAGAPGYNVYYAPTTQGTDGNPLEVGLASESASPYSGLQHLFVYDWSNPNGNSPCDQDGYRNCLGFATYAPTVDSAFTSKYVRVLSHGVPEWSVSTFQLGGYWYFGIYNYDAGNWEYPYVTHYTEVRHNFNNGRDGLGGGHGYFEYWLPPRTACAMTQPTEPAIADTYESDAQQFSTITNSWTRISTDKYLHYGISGKGNCFKGPTAPYFSVRPFADGWSDWSATGD